MNDLKRQAIVAIAQDRMSRQMKEDGTHILSGHPYTPSTQGSRVLAKYIATMQQQTLAAIYRAK